MWKLKVDNAGESSYMAIEIIDLDLHLLSCLCLEFMYQGLFTNEFVCCRFEVASQNNTSQILKRMVGLVEMNSHRETTAVVSDALFIQSKS